MQLDEVLGGRGLVASVHGWLDSQIRNGALFRHAVGANFNFTPAADAALYLVWLAAKVPDATLSARLTSVAAGARGAVAPQNYHSAAIGHVRYPVAALVFGFVPENTTNALNEGRAQLTLFQSDGSILYQPPAGAIDLGSTHWARDSNGLTASHVVTVLERGVFSGDAALIGEGLRLLRALNKFRDTVPRGAQTWEVPLHTPDILASAWLVRAYTVGYELTGEVDLLEQARYWAWTGVPFVYLTSPTDKPVGIYSTIPVFGATQFSFPWFGLPVQWCGLVYGDAIRRFARHDRTGPWVQLADGIAAAGVQQTHLASEPAYQGLLPDSFNLRAQARNPVPINPATLLPTAIQLFGEAPAYDFHCFRHHGLRVHAPGPLTELQETSQIIRFRANGWPKSPWHVLINGFTARTVKLNGIETPVQPLGRLILRLNAPTTLEISVPANNALNIQREATNAVLKLSWPATTTNSHLQSTTALAGDWTDVSTPVEVESAENVVRDLATGSRGFFRLSW